MQYRVLSVLLIAAVAALAAAGVAAAQSHPVVDGRVTKGEYAVEETDGAIRLYASFDSDTIYLAATGQTTGWVAVGVDSRRMDGAKIFMGYIANGKEVFTAQIGRRHSHSETDQLAVRSHAIEESNGATTIEIALDRRSFLEPGQTSLEVIYAMGSDDSLRQYHAQRGTTTLSVE